MNYVMVPNQNASEVVKFFADNHKIFESSRGDGMLMWPISMPKFGMIYDWKEDTHNQVEAAIDIEYHKIKDIKFESYPVKPKPTLVERKKEMREFVTKIIKDLKEANGSA